jgi:hypothetical protein
MIIEASFYFAPLASQFWQKFVIVYLSDMWNRFNFVALPVASMMTSKSTLFRIVAWLSLVMGFVIWCSPCVSTEQGQEVNQTLLSHPLLTF